MLWEPAFAHLITTKTTPQNTTPTIGTPVFGVDTSLSSTMFTNTAGTTVASAGNTVARVNDAFGSTAFSYQQGTAGERPTLVANALGNKPGLRFNGLQWLRMAPTSGSGTLFQTRTFTLAIVYRGRRADNAYSDLFANGNLEGGENAGGYDQLTLQIAPDGYPFLMRHTGYEFSGIYLNSVSIPSSTLVKLVARSSPTNGIEVRARTSVGAFSGTGSMLATADLYPWDAALIGGSTRWHEFAAYPNWEGDFFEYGFWGARASDALFDQLQANLDTKWGA